MPIQASRLPPGLRPISSLADSYSPHRRHLPHAASGPATIQSCSRSGNERRFPAKKSGFSRVGKAGAEKRAWQDSNLRHTAPETLCCFENPLSKGFSQPLRVYPLSYL